MFYKKEFITEHLQSHLHRSVGLGRLAAINLAVIKLLISVKRLEAPKWFHPVGVPNHGTVYGARWHVKKVYSKTKTRGTGFAELM